jgi:hypothetical protein
MMQIVCCSFLSLQYFSNFTLFEIWESTQSSPQQVNSRRKRMPLNPSVAEIIDPVFAKTSQNARFLLSENERFGLVFVKTGPINSGTAVLL